MEVDWGSLQAEAKTAGAYPDGDYEVIITESTATTSSNGKPMIKVKTRILSGPKKDKPLSTQFTISAESAVALKIFFEQMKVFGLGADFFASNPPMDVVAKNLLNRGAIFKVGSREWNGREMNDVKGVLPLPTGGPQVPGLVTTPPVAGPTGMTPMSPAASPAPNPTGPTSTPTPGAPPTTPF